MKKERKEALLRAFPAVPQEYMDEMLNSAKKRVTANFVVFLTYGSELFARCYHRYYNGDIVERQRYVFAKDGCCRYGSNDGKNWTIRAEFREPVFCASSYGYNFDNSYTLLNQEAIAHSCMKYSCVELYKGTLLMEYLKLYTLHPNLEYIMKQGYYSLIGERATGYWGGKVVLTVSPKINWKSNNLLKMLGLSRDEFKLLQGSENCYGAYIGWRENFPKYKPQELFTIAKAFMYEQVTAQEFCKTTGVRLPRLARYFEEQNIGTYDYEDYLDQCETLRYNLRDTAICMPHDFRAMHERLSEIIGYNANEDLRREFDARFTDRGALEFSSGRYIIRQPRSLNEITVEGKVLHHCVGGYAERHARGKLHILFIRRADDPDNPLYTMELGISGKIVQVRGLRNCAPSDDVKEFVEQYKQHIANVFRKVRITA